MTQKDLIINIWYVIDNGLSKAKYVCFDFGSYVFLTECWQEIRLSNLDGVSNYTT